MVIVVESWLNAGATGGAGLAGAALAIAGEGGGWALPALGFLLGGLAMPSYALCVAHANDRIEPGEVFAGSSALVLVYGAGSAAGPFLAGLLMDAAGGEALFPFFAGWLVACAVHAGARALLTRATPEAEKFDYTSLCRRRATPRFRCTATAPARPTGPARRAPGNRLRRRAAMIIAPAVVPECSSAW